MVILNPSLSEIRYKNMNMGQPRWLSGLALPSAQGVILKTGNRVPYRDVGRPAWSLLLPLPVSLPFSLSLSLSLCVINK